MLLVSARFFDFKFVSKVQKNENCPDSTKDIKECDQLHEMYITGAQRSPENMHTEINSAHSM